jgi:hypothetical protein
VLILKHSPPEAWSIAKTPVNTNDYAGEAYKDTFTGTNYMENE